MIFRFHVPSAKIFFFFDNFGILEKKKNRNFSQTCNPLRNKSEKIDFVGYYSVECIDMDIVVAFS